MPLTREELETGGARRSQLQINRRTHGAPADIRDKIQTALPRVHAKSRSLSVAPKLGKTLGEEFTEALSTFAPALNKALDQRDDREELAGQRSASALEKLDPERSKAFLKGHNKQTGMKLGLDVSQTIDQRMRANPDLDYDQVAREEIEARFGNDVKNLDPNLQAAAFDIMAKTLPQQMEDYNEFKFQRKRNEEFTGMVSTHSRFLAESRDKGFDSPDVLRQADSDLQFLLKDRGFDQDLINKVRINAMGEHFLRRGDPRGLIEHFSKRDPNGFAMINGPLGTEIRERADAIENYWYASGQRQDSHDAKVLKKERTNYQVEMLTQVQSLHDMPEGGDKAMLAASLIYQLNNPENTDLITTEFKRQTLAAINGEVDEQQDDNVVADLRRGILMGTASIDDVQYAWENKQLKLATYVSLMQDINSRVNGETKGPGILNHTRVVAKRKFIGSAFGAPDGDITNLVGQRRQRAGAATDAFNDAVLSLNPSDANFNAKLDAIVEDIKQGFFPSETAPELRRPIVIPRTGNHGMSYEEALRRTIALYKSGKIDAVTFKRERENLMAWLNSDRSEVVTDPATGRKHTFINWESTLKGEI